MFYLFWGILNIGLFILFVYYCVKGIKPIRAKYGLLASAVFVLIVLAVLRNLNEDIPFQKWYFENNDQISPNSEEIKNVILEKTLAVHFGMDIIYGKNLKTGGFFPLQAYSYRDGFVTGANWKPLNIFVTLSPTENKFLYKVEGVLEWRLLGVKLYSQNKTYQGSTILP